MKLKPALTQALALTFGCLLTTGTAFADAPLVAGDEPDRIESRNHKFFAEPSSDGKSTVIFRTAKPHSVPLWRKAGWTDNAYLADDGEFLVTGFYGNNLLDLDFTPSLTMLSFYRRETLVRSVSLAEIIKDMKQLRRTNSHYAWGMYEGFVSAHTFSVETVEGRRLYFDVATGTLIREERIADESGGEAAAQAKGVRKAPQRSAQP